MKHVMWIGGACLLSCASGHGVGDAERLRIEAAVVRVLEDQQRAWNDGDIDGFLTGYLPTGELTFVSGATVRRGFDETRDRYQERYATRERMGELTFSDLETRVLASDAAVVTGAWRLVRTADQPNGRFTLLFREVDGAWRIVLDHTSSAEE